MTTSVCLLPPASATTKGESDLRGFRTARNHAPPHSAVRGRTEGTGLCARLPPPKDASHSFGYEYFTRSETQRIFPLPLPSLPGRNKWEHL